MELTAYAPEFAPRLSQAYNELIHGLPYCYPVIAEAFAAAADAKPRCERLRADAAFVALEGGSTRAFAHVAVERPDDSAGAERGVIRALWYTRGHRAAGQAVLETAEQHLRAQGVETVIAFHQDYRYPFYHIGHAYLSDRLDHIHALLGMNGYQRCAGEIYLEWPDFQPEPPGPAPMPVELVREWLPGRGKLPGLTVRALQEGRQLGICENLSCGEYSAAEAAQDAFLTKWLGVDEDARGRGLGRYLLQEALVALRHAGYRRAVISTSWTNHRACLLYSNCGYHAVDWTYALSRNLTAGG